MGVGWTLELGKELSFNSRVLTAETCEIKGGGGGDDSSKGAFRDPQSRVYRSDAVYFIYYNIK
jgi:hypothetical protein